jgi:hypothetical protein
MRYMSKFSSSPTRFARSLNSMIIIEFNEHSILADIPNIVGMNIHCKMRREGGR